MYESQLMNILTLANHVLLANTLILILTSGGASYRSCLGNRLQGSWFTRKSDQDRDSGICKEGIINGLGRIVHALMV